MNLMFFVCRIVETEKCFNNVTNITFTFRFCDYLYWFCKTIYIVLKYQLCYNRLQDVEIGNDYKHNI